MQKIFNLLVVMYSLEVVLPVVSNSALLVVVGL